MVNFQCVILDSTHHKKKLKTHFTTHFRLAWLACALYNMVFKVKWIISSMMDDHIYITKISKSVSVYVCPAMRFVMLWCIELKVGMGVGDGPARFVGIFSKWPHLGSKVIQRSICLRNALGLPNLVKRTPGQSVVHCWGQRSCRGHQGSTKGQIA